MGFWTKASLPVDFIVHVFYNYVSSFQHTDNGEITHAQVWLELFPTKSQTMGRELMHKIDLNWYQPGPRQWRKYYSTRLTNTVTNQVPDKGENTTAQVWLELFPTKSQTKGKILQHKFD